MICQKDLSYLLAAGEGFWWERSLPSAVWFPKTHETNSAPAQPLGPVHSTGPPPVLGLFCRLRCYKCSLINLAKKPKGSFCMNVLLAEI